MLKTIKTEQVKSGMYIQELKSDWLSNPFWRKSFLLDNQTDLVKLQKSGIKHVVIDTKRGVDIDLELESDDQEDSVDVPKREFLDDVEVGVIDQQADEKVLAIEEGKVAAYLHVNESVKKPIKRISAIEEREAASKAIHSSKQAVASMFNDVRMGKAVSVDEAMPVVEELTASVMRNEGVLISLVRLKTQDDYTYLHSVAVCALMVALAKQLDLSEQEMRQAGLAGLMHDIGKAAIPNEILNKPGALTESEFDLVKLHPERGHALLLQAGVLDEATLDVCLHHHEKIDGSGYPHKLKGAQISVLAKMGAVCDVYDAVTSNRPYKAGWEPGISLQRMAKWTNHFDSLAFKAFVKSVGIYPIGTVVKLKSERLGVVIDQSPNSLLKPIVKVFFSIKDRICYTPEVIDLSDPKVKDEIVGQEDPVFWGIKNISSYWAE